jgi:hypothetical protein
MARNARRAPSALSAMDCTPLTGSPVLAMAPVAAAVAVAVAEPAPGAVTEAGRDAATV